MRAGRSIRITVKRYGRFGRVVRCLRLGPDSIRQSETTDGVTREYLVDTNRAYAQVIEEADNLSGLTRLYLYGDDLISQSRVSGNDVTTAQSDTFLYDGLGSVRTLTDSTGAITDTYTYEAFGGLDTHTGTNRLNDGPTAGVRGEDGGARLG